MTELKIAFDQQVFLLQEYGGISRYFCSLTQALNLMPGIDARIMAPLHFNRNLSRLKDDHSGGFLLPKLHPKLNRIAMEASKYSARYSIKKFAPDILHETYFSYDGFQPHSSKRVLTVYDFIHERYPEMFGPNNHMTTGPKKAAALRADHVICISHSTRRDLIEYCGVQEDKISVVYLGVDDVFKQENSSLGTAAKHPRPYLLFVGKRDGYKNFEKVVRAFSLSSRLKNDFDIVSFGGGALTQDELKIALDCRLRADQLVHYGGGDPVLAQLYSQAAAFIYPSLYEGFGIPPLEAMAAGCPVISSNTSSMPEVVGQAGEYFNPEDEDSMLSAIENVLYSNTHSADLIACGFEQGRKFSWQKCAAETLNIYRSIV